MKKAKKTAITTAVILILVGLTLVIGTLCSVGFGFSNLSTVTYSAETYPVSEPFRSIQILGDSADIRLLPSENEQSYVICTEENSISLSVSVKDETLIIREHNNRRWYDNIDIFWGDVETGISVFLPKAQYDALQVETTVGNVKIPTGFTFTDAHIASTTGDIAFGADVEGPLSIETQIGQCDLSNLSAQTVTAQSTAGDIALTGVTVHENLQIRSQIGQVAVNSSDAGSLAIETTSGDVTASLLSGKVFTIDSASGEVDVPPSAQGGSCHITTTIGDISVTVENKTGQA